MKLKLIILSGALLFAAAAQADNKTLDAAIGGGLGAAIGNEIGGRNGAIVGGALGAAVGTSGSHDSAPAPRTEVHYEKRSRESNVPGPGYHCPPGQAKKGRC